MIHSILRCLLLICCLSLFACQESSSGQEDATPLASDNFSGHVADLGQFLRPDEVQVLEELLNGYEAERGIRFLLYTEEQGDLAAMSKRLERRVDLSPKGLNASAFILVARQERQVKIEVNHGLEWQIPDSLSNVMLDGLIAALREKTYLAGFRDAYSQMYEQVASLPFELAYDEPSDIQIAREEAIGQIVCLSAQTPTPDLALLDRLVPGTRVQWTMHHSQGQPLQVRATGYMREWVKTLHTDREFHRICGRIRKIDTQVVLELMSVGH